MSRAFKTTCRVATTENIALAGEQVINGVSVVSGDRVLVNAQTNEAENGIRVVSAGDWSRASDMDSDEDLRYGAAVFCREPQRRFFLLDVPAPIVLGTTALSFVSIGDTIGGDGTFDPSDAPAFNRVAFVGTFPSPAVDPGDETGGAVAPFSTIQAALDSFDGYTQGTVTVLVDDAPYTENLGIRCEDKSIAIRALSGRRMQLQGTHSVRVSGSNYGLYVDGVGGPDHANTFNVVDAGSVATASYLVFRDCDNFTVAQNPGDSSVYNVFISADSNPVDTFAPMRFQCNAAYVTGALFTSRVSLGNGSSGTFRGAGTQHIQTVFRAGATLQSSTTGISMNQSRFAGNITVTFTGSAGILDLDGKSRSSWESATGTRTLTNGKLGTGDYSSRVVPNAGDYSEGEFRYDGPDVNGVTTEDTLKVRSARLATVSIQTQRSPRSGWYGAAWDTNDSVSREVMMGMQLRPIEGDVVSALLAFMYGIDGTVSDTGLSFTSSGQIYFGGLVPDSVFDGTLNLAYGSGVVAQRDSTSSSNGDTVFSVGTVAGDPNWVTLGSSNWKTRLSSSTIQFGSIAPDSAALEIRTSSISNGPGASWLFNGTRSRFRADGHTAGTDQPGLPARFAGGPRTGTGAKGGVEIGLSPDTNDANFEYMTEAVEVANGRRVLALLGITAMSTTKMPTDTGDGVMHIAPAQTEPTAAPGSGCIVWVKSSNGHLMAWPSGAGAPVDLTP